MILEQSDRNERKDMPRCRDLGACFDLETGIQIVKTKYNKTNEQMLDLIMANNNRNKYTVYWRIAVTTATAISILEVTDPVVQWFVTTVFISFAFTYFEFHYFAQTRHNIAELVVGLKEKLQKP
jgi:hypothetical protein